MPRKPSSVFVIAMGLNSDQGQVYREPLTEIQGVDEIVARHYQQHPVGTTVFVVEDTRVDAYRVGLKLDPVDDPRLPDRDDGGP